jgi:uncharacterized protein
MFTNRLAREKSPYLLQHAHNPVDWYAWGEAAFEKARRENKPIFLSVGYSTCHWCHVMERESFEDTAVAALLNEHFVAVKVDREERPDVDRIYMLFVQAATGSGGWPMSVWLTPEREPFFGGTYFRREDFAALLERMARAWQTDAEGIRRSSAAAVGELQQLAMVQPGAASVDHEVLENAFQGLRRSFDEIHGGFERAPKFPRPVNFNFLLRYGLLTRNQEALAMVLKTLREMAKGGIRDHLGGGFHRYSVDERWLVPHFEKMLYDQAQLASSYLEAATVAGDVALERVAREIFAYVLRDLRHPEGGFYSAEDADSAVDAAKPEMKEEGAFYLWRQEEVIGALGEEAGARFCQCYGVGKDASILHEVERVEQMDLAKAKLLEVRAQRARPQLDEKVLTGWNGLMISALMKGGEVEAARAAAEFVWSNMYRPKEKILLRRLCGGEAGIAGFLEDYAFFTQALIDLYESEFRAGDLDRAILLATRSIELFEDREDGAFYSTTEGAGDLVLRMKDDYDGAEPSGNSVMVTNLLRLAALGGRDDFRAVAERTLKAFGARMTGAGLAVPQMLIGYALAAMPPEQVCDAFACRLTTSDLTKFKRLIE